MKTVVVGMSGGVDSSVAAYLLKQQGYNVIGVTMQIWQEEDTCTIERNGGCCGASAVADARRVANCLDIPYYVMNFREVFRHKVIDYFIKEYRSGRTPNPCIACNRYVKWQSLLEKSLAIGADYIATGHYAKVVQLDNGRWTLQTSKELNGKSKDQTYALYNLTQSQLARTLMPIGEYTKDEVRKIAEDAGLPVAHKPDSEEICFVPDNDYAGFIERDTGIQDKPGNFIDLKGKILGKHKGITHYTVGQRRGLGLAVGHPIFVKKICPATNEIILAENADLLENTLEAVDINIMAKEDIATERVMAKIRYNSKPAAATIEKIGDDRIRCTFDSPQCAITPGQSVVFYQDDHILGGGTIV